MSLPDSLHLLRGDHDGLRMAGKGRQADKISIRVNEGVLQVVHHLRHGVVATIHTLLGTFQDNLLQAVGNLRVLAGRLHLLLKMLDGNGHCALPVKGNPARNHLIHGDTQRIDIALGVTVAAPHLLGRAVVHGAHHIGADGIGRGSSGNTEIRKLHLSVYGNDNILGLHIPMDDAAVVGGLQSQRHLDSDAGGLADTQLALSGDVILQGDSFHQLHDNIVNSIVLPHIVHINDIGMGEAGRRLGLPLELVHKVCISAELSLHNLESHHTVQLVILGLIDISHAAGAHPADDLITLPYNHALF